jgi:DNA-directed RNA polymerase specialized sigma24 family protein
MTPPDNNVPDFNYILRLVKRILPNGYDHESIAAELVCRGLESRVRVSFTSIRNYCLDHRRRQNSERFANEVWHGRRTEKGRSSNTQSPDDTLAAILSSARLSGTDRQILIHKYWLGRSDIEIAHALGLPAYRVTELRNQALDRLRTVAKELFPRED